MQIKTLYRYKRPDGGITITPEKPETTEFDIRYRIIADKGKILTVDGDSQYSCIDVDSTDGWYEVDDPNYEQGGEI
jgi:hypothetical protein